jgi:hypothetical protein
MVIKLYLLPPFTSHMLASVETNQSWKDSTIVIFLRILRCGGRYRRFLRGMML